MVGYLVRLTVGEPPDWMVGLAEHLFNWTGDANGPHGEDDRDRDNRPYTWNAYFFEFAGILAVAIPHVEMMAKFVSPITGYKDEAFHDAMGEFLRGFDRATLAIDTKKPENPADVRAKLADRIRRGWNFRRLCREKGMSSETHAGDALSAMFFQPSRIQSNGRAYIPENWPGLELSIDILASLAADAGTSGYIATLFLNLVETNARAIFLPHVVRVATAWCTAYGVDSNFWVEKNFGFRLCAWLERVLSEDETADLHVKPILGDLLRCLDVLIRAGVAQAREIEERLSADSPS